MRQNSLKLKINQQFRGTGQQTPPFAQDGERRRAEAGLSLIH